MFGLGMGEVIVILVLALIVLGPKKLPELAKTIGKGFRDFQRAKQGLMDDINVDINIQDADHVSGQQQYNHEPHSGNHADNHHDHDHHDHHDHDHHHHDHDHHHDDHHKEEASIEAEFSQKDAETPNGKPDSEDKS